MLRGLMIACGMALGSCIFAQSAGAATHFAFTGAADRSGDLQGPLEVVNDFTVTSTTGIDVSQLGIFIDGFDGVTGLSEDHVVSLYSRGSTPILLASATLGSSFDSIDGPYAYNNPQNSNSNNPQLQGGWGYVNIPQLFLPNGFTGSIVAYTMSDGSSYTDDYGESVPFNTGGGLISFTKSYRGLSSGTTGDTTNDASNEVLGAGSFTFAAAPPLTPEPAALGIAGVGGLLVTRRRRSATALTPR
jgi:MYXO-CTERM domain-containing protein